MAQKPVRSTASFNALDFNLGSISIVDGRHDHSLLAAIVEASDDAILSKSLEGIILTWNGAAERMFGYTAKEIVGKPKTILFPPDRLHEEEAILDRLRQGISTDHFETVRLHKDGTRIEVSVTISPVKDAGGDFVAASSILRNITQLRRMSDLLQQNYAVIETQNLLLEGQRAELLQTNAHLEEAVAWLEVLATTDVLTGLKNHRAFQDRFKQEYDHAIRYRTTLSVALLDVDRFKHYYDTHGHLAGDIVLKQIGEILLREARSSDIVARYGGEEFVLLLPETDAEEARKFAERLRQEIETALWEIEGVTASFGLATLSALTKTSTDLLDAADRAMYRSKSRGRNCVTHCIDELAT